VFGDLLTKKVEKDAAAYSSAETQQLSDQLHVSGGRLSPFFEHNVFAQRTAGCCCVQTPAHTSSPSAADAHVQVMRNERLAQVSQDSAAAGSMHVVSGAPPGEDPQVNPDGQHISGRVSPSRVVVQLAPGAVRLGRFPALQNLCLASPRLQCKGCGHWCACLLQTVEEHQRQTAEMMLIAELEVYEVSLPGTKRHADCQPTGVNAADHSASMVFVSSSTKLSTPLPGCWQAFAMQHCNGRKPVPIVCTQAQSAALDLKHQVALAAKQTGSNMQAFRSHRCDCQPATAQGMLV